MKFAEFFGYSFFIITILTPFAIVIAGTVDLCRNWSIRRTLPRFLIALVTYPALVFFSFCCIAVFEMRVGAFFGGQFLDLNIKIFLILFLLAYAFCSSAFAAFVAQKLPFLKQAFNPVEEHLPSILTTK